MKNTKFKLCVSLVVAFTILVTLYDLNTRLNLKTTIDEKNINRIDNEPLVNLPNVEEFSSGDYILTNRIDNFEIVSGDFKQVTNSGEISSIAPPIIKENLNCSHVVKTFDDSTYSGDFYLGNSENYNKVDGITTFRGNNYRDSAFFGEVEINENKLTKVWTNNIGRTDNWTGVGWNGQPAIVRWDDTIKKQMNIFDEFKEKENFTEVIYGALDSMIHFYDLETGYPCRNPIKVKSSIKGSVTIDPRGYPLLYVGQGINEVSGESVPMGYHIFSLITGEELLFINGRDKFAYLGWGAFDGNPIIDANTDTMILPGENGVIYIVKLNTNYDKLNGTISLNPQITRYKTTIEGRAGGTENSIVIYKNLAYFANNNGIIQCLNLNTLTPVWNFKMEDDCDATIGLEVENDIPMLYEACEVDRRKAKAPAVARKINGLTSEAIWEYSCECLYDGNVNGGALSSVVIGKDEIEDLVIFNFSKTTSYYNGKMVALNKENGNVIWEKDLEKYSWSSPTAIYSTSGKAYLIFCNSVGQVLLIDTRTGETLYTLNTGGGNIEGSPAIFNNKIIIGTRGKRIYCIEIS